MADGSGSPEQLKMTFQRFGRFLPKENILVVTLPSFEKRPVRFCRRFQKTTSL